MDTRDWGLFALVALLWGVPYLFISIALVDLGPFQVSAGRVLIASLFLGPVLATRGRWHVFVTHWPKLLVVAAVEVAIPFSLIAIGELTVPSGTTGVLIALEPLFIALLAPHILRGSPPLTLRGWLGLLLGLGGVTILLGLDLAGPGVLLIVGAALSYGIGAMLMDKWFSDTESITSTSGMILAATPLLLLIALATEPLTVPSASSAMAVLVLGLACTAGGFAAFFALIKRAGPTRASLITHAAPIVALVAGVIVLGERITERQVLGCALILLGTGLVMHKSTAAASSVGRRDGITG